ncbi:MAG: leucine-rich repeat protein [Ruminococcus sp.]|nr:leucine-rich repeat protein [Ruminococcus sp.]
MIDIRDKIDRELVNLSFDTAAVDIENIYKRKQRKIHTAYFGTLGAFLIAVLIILNVNTGAVTEFMKFSGSALSSFFGISDSEKYNANPTSSSPVKALYETESTAKASTKKKKEDKNSKKPATENTTVSATNATSQKSLSKIETKEEKEKKYDGKDFEYQVLSDKTLKLTAYNGDSTDIKIPSEINDNKVSVLGEKLFKDSSITSVLIPDTVTEIEYGAFENASKLENVEMSKNIKNIGSSAFYSCVKLKKIDFYNVKSIGSSAFGRCDSLSEVTVPSTAAKVGTAAFCDCSGLKVVYLNSDCDDQNAFEYNRTFAHCESLKTLYIGEGVKTIASYAFYQCTALKNIYLPSSLRKIGVSAFSCCTTLENINIPQGVQNIYKHAFYKCRKLNKVELPVSLWSIEEEAFYGCNSLLSIAIPYSTTLKSKCLGYSDTTYEKKLVIQGFKDSTAMVYAQDNKFEFVELKTSISLSSYIESIKVGEKYKINPIVKNPAGASYFTSSDEKVATVSPDGTVLGKKAGTATITITNNNVNRKFVIVVK